MTEKTPPIRRAIVTGAAGYVGWHVVAGFAELGIPVVALVRPGTDRDFPEGVDVVEADVLAEGFDLGSITREGDALVHLAWQDGFTHNAESHLLRLSDHFRFLGAAADAGVARITALGSMHEVGYWEGAIDASTPCSPLSLYGIAKNALRMSSLLSIPPRTSFAWLRCYYIYGDDRRNRSVFTKLLEAADRGDATFPFTSGVAEYDFLPVEELGRQIVAATLAVDETGIIECCSGVPVSLGEMVERFIADRRLGIRLEYGAFPDRPYDSPGVWGDATRIASITAKG